MAMNDVGIKITAQDATGNAFNSVGGKLGALKTQAAGIGDTIGGLVGKFGALGLAISSAMSVASVKNAIDVADQFGKMAQKTGVAVEALRELNYAASLSDVSTDALRTGLQKLSQNMAMAAGGSKLQAEAFKAMGLSLKDSSGSLKGADAMLTEIAAKFANFKDGPEKAAMAINLFGKAGGDMIPLLNTGATGLADMAQEARDLGAVFGGDMAKNAEAFNDNLTRIATASQGAFYSIANELLPTLNQLSQAFLDAQKSGSGFGSFIGGALKTGIEAIAILFSDVKFVLVGIGNEIGGIAAQIAALGRGDLKGFTAISDAMKADAARARAELDKWQFQLLNSGILTSTAGAGRGTGADPRILGSTQTSAPIVAQAAAAATAAKTISEASKGLALYNDLMDDASGFAKNWAEDINKLRAALDGKTISQTQFNEAANALLQKQPVMVAAAKAQADAQKEITKEIDASAAAQQKLVAASFDELDKAQAAYEAHGKLASVLQEESLARLENSRLITAMAGEDTAALDVQIANKKKVIAALQGTELKNAADDLAKANQKAAEESAKYWEDALMRAFESGKGFFQSLWDTIKNTLKTQVLRVLVSATGMTGMSAAGAVGMGGGGGGNLLGTASSLGNIYDTITGGFAGLSDSVAFAAQDMGAWLVNNTSGVLNQAGASLMQSAGTFGTVAGYAAGAAAGLAIGKAISGGYGSNTAVNAGTIIGSVVGGPIGGAIGGAIGGLVNRAFGRKATELLSSGTRGTFSGEEFSGSNYANYQKKGGWFRSDKNWTDVTALDPATVSAWSTAFAGVKGSVTGMAASLGLATDKIAAYSKYVDIAAGTTSEQLTAIFTGMADDMAAAAAPGLSAFAQAGESASTTLSRLGGSLQVVNMWLGTLDHSLLTMSLSGGDAASKLADAFGGLDAMATASKAYYDLFWSDAERLADTASNVAKGLALVNVAMPITKDAFRDVVSALDLTTDAGRNTYAVMLALAPEFAQVADAAAASVSSFFDTLQKRLTDLQQSIASERESVAGARAGILLAAPKTAAQLAAEIAATKVAMPTDAGVISALAARTAAQAGMAAAQSAQSATSSVYGTALSSAQAGLNSTVDKYKNLAAYFQNMAVSFNGYQIKVNATGTNNDAFSYNAGTNQLNPWNSTSDATQTGRAYRHFIGDTAAFTAAMTNNGTLGALQGGNAELATAAAAVATAQAAYNSAMTATTGTLNTATAAKNAADAAVKQAVLDYAAAMTQYSGDAEKAVKVLGALREETVAYYEAQKELAGLLIASAANLREAVRATRFGQLDEQAGLAQQQSSFAQNYSLALSTTGATKAGYADQLGAALPGLSTALMDASATRADWALATSSLFAQSDTIAAQLEAEAGAMNYQAESLALLDSIDVSLMELDTNTAILKNAIDGGAASTAAGLRAIVTQLGGVPSFDVGTNYVPQDMFARVHQGEAIVPRAFNPAAMSQGGATVEMVQELRALRTEVAGLRSEAAATAGHTSKTARLLDRAMPDGDAMATRAAS